MKATGRIQKWVAGALGVVFLALLVNLVLQFSRLGHGEAHPRVAASPVGNATPPPAPRRATATTSGKQKVPDELSRYDPMVNLDLLKEFQDRPLPELDRNPFQFVESPAKVSPNRSATAATAATGAAAAPPPAPPPVSLKPMGYTEGTGGIKEAMVSDEDQVFVVHEGDSVGTRYKIIKITPTMITVEDATLHQTVDLPIPQ
jgi:hypothetical protein